jgi:hypothetical protein
MRIDLVLLVMLVSWIGLGFTGSELIQTKEELNVCESQIGLANDGLQACLGDQEILTTDLSTCRNQVTEAESQLGTCQTSLEGAQAETARLNGVLDACELDKGRMQGQLETVGEWNSGTKGGVVLENSAPATAWFEIVAVVLAAVSLTVRQIVTGRRKVQSLPNDAMRVTEMERELIVNLRRKTRRQ